MNEEDGGLYGHMNIDMEDWDDGLLTGNVEDEMLWGSGWESESTYGHSALFEEVHDEVMVGEDMDLLENIEICLNHESEEVKAMLEDMK
jgi:hypothetical protein